VCHLTSWRDRLQRSGVEAPSFSRWIAAELLRLGLPVIVVEAIYMQKALSAQRNKTDRNDARGIAHMMRMGWFRVAHGTSPVSPQLRFLLSGRRLLKRKFLDVENELRGAFKAFGVVIGAGSRGQLEARNRPFLGKRALAATASAA
jgi:transposase